LPAEGVDAPVQMADPFLHPPQTLLRMVKPLLDVAHALVHLVPKLVQTPIDLIDPLTQLLPGLVETPVHLINALAQLVPHLIQTPIDLIDPLTQLLPGLVETPVHLINALAQLVPHLIQTPIHLVNALVQTRPKMIHPLINALYTLQDEQADTYPFIGQPLRTAPSRLSGCRGFLRRHRSHRLTPSMTSSHRNRKGGVSGQLPPPSNRFAALDRYQNGTSSFSSPLSPSRATRPAPLGDRN
jgi:hypothetical protein